MRVDINRQLDILPQRSHQIIALLRRHDTRHILNTQRITAHLLDLLAERNEHLQIVNRAERIADTALCVAPRLQALIHCNLDIA